MLLDIFIVSGFLFFLFVLAYRLTMNKIKNYDTKTRIVGLISLFILVYVLSGIILFILNPNKILYLLFALSPFIIGKLAVYKKEKYYTFLQILTVALSIIYSIGNLKL